MPACKILPRSSLSGPSVWNWRACKRSCSQEIRIVRVLADPGLHEWALSDDLQPLRTNLVERALHESGADALAAELRRHLGMHEGNHAAVPLVVGRGQMAVDLQLIAMMGIVVDDFVHVASPSVLQRVR